VAFNRLHIVQQYLDRPALIDGRKFDLRLYVLVTSFFPLRVYLFRDAIVRLATARYDMGDVQNIYSHLTNSSINKARDASGCKRALSQLGSEGKGAELLRRPDLRERLAHLINLTILSIAANVPDNGGTFELLGFDVLIDGSGAPWLIEVNTSPALSVDGPADVTVKAKLLAEMLDVLVATKFKFAPQKSSPLSTRGHRPPSALTARGATRMCPGFSERRTSVGVERWASVGEVGARATAGGMRRSRPSHHEPSEIGADASIGGWDLIFPWDEHTRVLARGLAGREGEVVGQIRSAIASLDGRSFPSQTPTAAAPAATQTGGVATVSSARVRARPPSSARPLITPPIAPPPGARGGQPGANGSKLPGLQARPRTTTAVARRPRPPSGFPTARETQPGTDGDAVRGFRSTPGT